jgi:hypothetical protein
METSNRFNQAVEKLYKAFHENTLNPLSCTQCAVGNILDNKPSWKELSDYNGSLKLNYVGIVHQRLDRKFNGFSPLELLQIEAAFLKACGYTLPLHKHVHFSKKRHKQEILFDGLVAVVEQLCVFDNIPNIMDCSALFDFDYLTSSVDKRQFSAMKEIVLH